MTHSRCLTRDGTEKQAWSKASEARRVARRLQSRQGAQGAGLAPYRCRDCHQYHLATADRIRYCKKEAGHNRRRLLPHEAAGAIHQTPGLTARICDDCGWWHVYSQVTSG